MATAQLQRTQSKTWEAIFPNEQVTEQKSTLFVKKLLAVAISNITYLRAIFPERAFGDKCLEDLNLKILRDESSCPGACQVIKWVKGCFDALDKKYLRTLVIGIYVDPDNPATVIESYTFKFTYNNNGEIDIYRNNKKISSAHSAEETKKATIRLLRTLIILTNTLTSLPDSVMMTMKLFYYDDVTPADYEPPGFKASGDGTFMFAEEATNIAIGEVATGGGLILAPSQPSYQMIRSNDKHKPPKKKTIIKAGDRLCPQEDAQQCSQRVKMRVKTGSKQFEMHEDPIEEMEQVAEEGLSINNAGLDDEVNGANQPVQEKICDKGTAVSACINTTEREKTPCNSSPADPGSVVNSDKHTNGDDFQVRCPCGCNEDDGLMVMCSNCMFWQHGICFLITSEDKAPSNHICDVCAKATCLWRRALSACMEFKRVVTPQLARRLGIENTVAQGLINRLEKEGFISNSKKGKKLGKIVEKEKIENIGIPRYLTTSKNLSKIDAAPDADSHMDVQATAKEPSVTKDNKIDKSVETLVKKTNQINLRGSKSGFKNLPAQETVIASALNEAKGRRGKKRAYSRQDSNEFEVTDSQEMLTTKKKASTVTKDITV